MQPMMIISGDQFPTPLGVIFARWAWRYRSELAPAYLTMALGVAGWWAHAAYPHRWPFVVVGAAICVVVVTAFGARLGLTAVAERVYVTTCMLAAGAWLAEAEAHGPFRPPLPMLLGFGAVLLAVPWWAHRRRRAKVRVDRTLAAWPDIAQAIGLAGSQVMSATVDTWGWRARFRLARGQTIADVTARIAAIESGLGTFRGAVRVYPTPDDLANRAEIRVLNRDPHADAIAWPGPSVTTITEPIDIGPFEDAEPCRVLFLRRHALFAGTTGAGKSGGLNVLLGNLAACCDVVVWAIDLKQGIELSPWQDCLGRLATNPEEATALLRDAVAIVRARAEWLASHGRRTWEPSPGMPALVIIIDEYAELAEQAPDAMGHADALARLGRAVAVTLVAATQRPTQKAMGQGAVRSQMDVRICFRVRERRDVDLVLGQGMLSAGWNAHKLNAPGKFLVSAPEHDTPRRARAYLVTDQAVIGTTTHFGPQRPELDYASQSALHADRVSLIPWPGDDDHAPADAVTADMPRVPEDSLWALLRSAPPEGWAVGDLINLTGMTRATLYRRLRELAIARRASQVTRGHWCAWPADDDPRDSL
jgi:S-DNA-T family DNA segregation ATPase FtsK/SpoIIIE